MFTRFPLDDFLTWAILCFALVGVIALVFLISWIIDRYMAKKQDSLPRHPYFCTECNYDLVGNVAISMFQCPECGLDNSFNNQDALIARALIQNKRIDVGLKEFLIYECVEKDGRQSFLYRKNVMCVGQEDALNSAKSEFGQNSVIIPSSRFPSEGSVSLIPPVLILSKPADHIAIYGSRVD
jgi:predicted nucleic-acid-binding Zn-ribbon protein